MQKDVFEKVLKLKVSQITFGGHRVNDDYSLNKRKAIMAVVMSAFDEAAENSMQSDGATWESLGKSFVEVEPDHSEGE